MRLNDKLPWIASVALAFSITTAAAKISKAELQDAISSSDQYEKYRDVLLSTTQKLVEDKKCSLPQIKRFHGWKQVGDILILQCGSFEKHNQSNDRWYLEPETARLYQVIAPARKELSLSVPNISADDLHAGNARSLSAVRLPWGESLLGLMNRQRWRLVVHQNGSPGDFSCNEHECHLELHLLDTRNPRTTKNSCGLLFRFTYDRRAGQFRPAEWRAMRIWEHKENELVPYFADRYATFEC